jgi:hypothetical protein
MSFDQKFFHAILLEKNRPKVLQSWIPGHILIFNPQSEENLITQIFSSPPGAKPKRYFSIILCVINFFPNKSVFKTNFPLQGAWRRRRRKLGKLNFTYYEITLSRKSIRSNDFSVKCTFGLMTRAKNFRSNDPLSNFFFRSNDIFCRK